MKVSKGEVWEFLNNRNARERHTLVWIMRVERQGKDPRKDIFTYITLDSSDVEATCLETSHLTIRDRMCEGLWKRLV